MELELTLNPPTRLSDLIELAIDDAQQLDRKLYKPASLAWHEPKWDLGYKTSNTCLICLAGAVIARTLECETTTSVQIESETDHDANSSQLILTEQDKDGTILSKVTGNKWQEALVALDAVRKGKWTEAARILHDNYPTDEQCELLKTLRPPKHEMFYNWDSFDAHLVSLTERAKQLRNMGL